MVIGVLDRNYATNYFQIWVDAEGDWESCNGEGGMVAAMT